MTERTNTEIREAFNKRWSAWSVALRLLPQNVRQKERFFSWYRKGYLDGGDGQ